MLPAASAPRILLALAALLASALSAQTADTHAYNNAALHLGFLYPANLDPEDPGNVDNYSFRTRFALHPDSDPEHRGADPCSPLLLAVGTGPDQPLDPGKKLKPGKQVPLQAAGGITLNEIKHACLAKDSFNAPDEKSLADLVENARHIDGQKPIPRAISYELQGAKIFFAASTPDEKSRKGDAAFTANVGAIVNGRIFLWSITANDDALFNRMLHSKVCFDAPACAGGYQTLVPYQVDASSTVKPFAP